MSSKPSNTEYVYSSKTDEHFAGDMAQRLRSRGPDLVPSAHVGGLTTTCTQLQGNQHPLWPLRIWRKLYCFCLQMTLAPRKRVLASLSESALL